MNGPQTLAGHTGVMHTRMGAFWPGQRAVFRGHDLHREFRHLDWLELFVFGITGRRFTPAQMRLLHAIWVITSYPDSRIWNNRIAALAGSVRSTPALGLSAALAISEATIYGGGAGLRAYDFITRAAAAVETGRDLADFVREEVATRYLYGYGRPIHANDERLQWLAKAAEENGYGEGRHFRLAFAVGQTLIDIGKPRLRMNYAGMVAALGADLGLSRREFHLFRVPLFFGGMPPCWIEASEKPEGAIYPTPCSKLVYEGVAARPWKPESEPSHG